MENRERSPSTTTASGAARRVIAAIAVAVALASSLLNAESPPPPRADLILSRDYIELTEAGTLPGSVDRARSTYTIALAARDDGPLPDGEPVTIVMTADTSEISIHPPQVTFTHEDFDTPQTITVEAVPDKVPDGTTCTTIRHDVVATDNNPSGVVTPQSLTVAVIDDDRGDLVIRAPNGNQCPAPQVDVKEVDATEAGGTDSYTVALTWQPADDVTVEVLPDRLRAGLTTGVSAKPVTLIFTSQNYRTPQTVTVAALDDRSVEAGQTHTDTIRHSVQSSDSAYTFVAEATKSVKATIADNDAPGIRLAESGDSTYVVEGAAGDAYAVSLHSRPLVPVTVSVEARLPVPPDSDRDPCTPGDPQPGDAEAARKLVVTPPSVTFMPAAFETPQTMTVSAANDADARPPQVIVLCHFGGGDSDYTLARASVTVHVTDNDAPNVAITEPGGATALAEGGPSKDYSVALTKRPTADVTVEIRPGSQMTADAERITFSAENFDEAQPIRLTAVDDRVFEGTLKETVSHTVVSNDVDYALLNPRDVVADIFDNDVPVTVTETGDATNVVEGGAPDSYMVTLTAQPEHDVTITVSAGGGLIAEPEVLRFTPGAFADGQAAQTVTITLSDTDRVAAGARRASVGHEVSSEDKRFEIPLRSISVDITDDDQAGILLRESEGSTAVGEDGTSDAYDVALLSQPTADVTIAIDAGDQVKAVPATLTFTAANFDRPQSVMLRAIDDAAVEGAQAVTVKHAVSSADGGYAGMVARDIEVTVADNDSAPVVQASSGGGGGSWSWLGACAFLAAALWRRAVRRCPWIAATGIALAMTAGLACADPPYGADFDAPDNFAGAVAIAAGYHQATLEGAQDLDFYRFAVAAGQDIYVSCSQQVAAFKYSSQPCAAELLDPSGVPRGRPMLHAWYPGAQYSWLTLDVQDAAPGEWRLQVAGAQVAAVDTSLLRYGIVDAEFTETPYGFGVTLTLPGTPATTFGNPPADQPGGGGGGGGGGGPIDLATSLLLAALARARMRPISSRISHLACGKFTGFFQDGWQALAPDGP
jgi:hypothetical protein